MNTSLVHFHIAPKHLLDVHKTYGQQCVKYFTKSGEIDFIGYLTDEECITAINQYNSSLEDASLGFWKAWENLKIDETIEATIAKCQNILPLNSLPVHCYIFPWHATASLVAEFDGVNAVVPHNSVFHFYIDPLYPRVQSTIAPTIAHEFTHLYYYEISTENDYTLFDHMIMEGIAEVFREELLGGDPAIWSTQLDKKTAVRIYADLTKILESKDTDLHQQVLFGGDRYAKWSGYSIGYYLVKQERVRHPSLNWQELIAFLKAKRDKLKLEG